MTPVEKDPARGLNGAIAAELRAERAAMKITFDDVAERSGLSKRTVLRLFNAERAVTMAYLEAVCEAMGVQMSHITERAEARLRDESWILAAKEAPRWREETDQ